MSDARQSGANPCVPKAELSEDASSLVERLSVAAVGMLEVGCVYIGARLGFYRQLATTGPLTPKALAAATRTDERYVREWLEQQAAANIVTVHEAVAAGDRAYSLSPQHADVLLDETSLNYVVPLVRQAVGITGRLPELLRVFATGEGISWEAYGPDVVEGQAAQNRPLFEHLLGKEWIPGIPDVHARLLADPPARVADVACGLGWSSIALARAYRKIRVDGYDLDLASIAAAQRNVEQSQLQGRVTMNACDVGDARLVGSYDLVTMFEALHDMPRPVEVLRKVRKMLVPGGTLIIADEKVGESFSAPAERTEQMMYVFSVLCCLPVGRADPPSVGTGAVMRPAVVRQYALEAGYSSVDVLPVVSECFLFYRLVP